MRQHHPDVEIAGGNPWYLADQFRSQLGTRGRRRVIEDRWRTFAGMLRDWRRGQRTNGTISVLDAGCGDGINLVGLTGIASRERLPLRLFGVDYNEVRLGRAALVAPSAALQRASLYALPFRNDCFDAVLCNHVIEHVPDLQRALGELRRVLRPGGLLIVGVPNEGSLMGRLRNHVIQRSIGRTTDHVHFFTAQSLVDALQRAGTRIRRVERETFFFPCSYVNAACNEFGVGHLLMAALRALLPSQAGGLIVATEKPVHA